MASCQEAFFFPHGRTHLAVFLFFKGRGPRGQNQNNNRGPRREGQDNRGPREGRQGGQDNRGPRKFDRRSGTGRPA